MPNYWCLVALDYLCDCAYIMAESDDCLNDDVVNGECDISEVAGMEWATNRAAGLYRLTLQFDMDVSDDVTVSDAELVMAFPPLPEGNSPDYLTITKNVLRDEP